MGLRPKSRANLCHPGHLKTLRRAAASQLYERSFMVGFGRDLLLFILSIKKSIWPIGTFEVTALAAVAFEPFFLSLHRRYATLTGVVLKVRHHYFRFGCTHEFPPTERPNAALATPRRALFVSTFARATRATRRMCTTVGVFPWRP